MHLFAVTKKQTNKEPFLTINDRHQLGAQGRNMTFQTNEFRKQESLSILIYDKIDFRPKLFKRYKEDQFILIQRAIHQEDIAVLHLYALNTGVPNLMKIR